MRTLLPHAAAFAGLLPLLFAACSTSPAGASDLRVVKPGDFTMATGERVALADRGTLRYVRVTNDSRCLPGRQCVWAGDAEVVFEWTGDGAGQPEEFSLHTGRGDRSKDLAGHRLTLASLARGAEPEAQLKLEAIP